MSLEQPKRPSGGPFGRFCAEKRIEFQQQCPGKPVGVVMKLAADRWKALSDEEKQPYQKAFEVAMLKYKEDFAAFIEAGGVKTKGAAALRTERKKIKLGLKVKKIIVEDPNKPKQPVGGAYGCFLTHSRPALMQECPGVSGSFIANLASARWKELSAGEKEVYEKAFQEKLAAYKEAMKGYVPPDPVEGEEEQGGEEEGPPVKRAKIDLDVLAKAKKEHLSAKLEGLMQRPEVAAKNLSASVVFQALRDAGGKVPAAKRALQSAQPGDQSAEEPDEEKEKGKDEEGGDEEDTRGVAANKATAVDAGILAQAKKEGLHQKLKALVQRPELIAKTLDAADMLKALQDAGGKVCVAKRALLGA